MNKLAKVLSLICAGASYFFSAHYTFAENRINDNATVVAKNEKKTVETLFQENCASCHGKNLTGGLGSNLVDDVWKFGSTDKQIFNTIKLGQLELGMPEWQTSLSDEQIRGLVVYIREEAAEYKSAENKPLTSSDNGLFKTQDYHFTLKSVAEFDDIVWGITFFPNGDLLATEKSGQLWLQKTNGERIQISGTPQVWQHGQGGLLDVAVHPDYPRQPWIYLSYAENKGGEEQNKTAGMTAVSRGQIINGQWQQNQQIFSADNKLHTNTGAHFGSRFVLNNGYVYFSIGDRGRMEMAQDLTKPNGKIHRLYYDGRVPQDNPFASTKNAIPSIWSYGHRNPQGLALHPQTGELWETEHGPRGGDEINLIKKSLNYGWPVITYGINYNGKPITDKTEQEGMEQPKHYWVPSIATGGIEFYRGKVFAKWQNDLLVTGMAKQELRRITIKDNKVVGDEILLKDQGRIRDVAVSPDGDIYIVINDKADKSGKVFKLILGQDITI